MGVSKEIPFYSNTPENVRCVQACLRMILKHLLDREFSWQELDDLTQSGPDEVTSPAAALVGMTKLGLQATLVADFDHLRFSEEGIDYVRHTHGDEVANWQLANGNVEKSRALSRDLFSSSVLYEHRTPKLEYVNQLLEQGYGVFCGVNSRIINNKEGYSGHSVVMLGLDDTTVKIHDPGLPPKPHLEVPIQKFTDAWESHGANVRAVRLPEE